MQDLWSAFSYCGTRQDCLYSTSPRFLTLRYHVLTRTLTILRHNTYSLPSALKKRRCLTYHLIRCEINIPWKNQEVTVEEKRMNVCESSNQLNETTFHMRARHRPSTKFVRTTNPSDVLQRTRTTLLYLTQYILLYTTTAQYFGVLLNS